MFSVVLGVAPQLAAEIAVLRRCSAIDSRPSVADATRALSVVANGGCEESRRRRRQLRRLSRR